MNYPNIIAVIEPVLYGDAVKATKYISRKSIIRATRKRFHKRILTLTNHNAEITLTVGKPNFIEREFIKDCIKAGEPFPVKKVQLKLYNPPKKKLKPNKRK